MSRRASARLRAPLSALLAIVVVAGGLALGSAPASAQVPTPIGSGNVNQQTAVVNVDVAGTRAASGAAQPLEGVRLELRRRPSGNVVGGTAVATCVSDAQGDCSFVLSKAIVDGGNDFWVVQGSPAVVTGSPAEGYTANTGLVTGLNSGDFEQTDYRFRIDDVELGELYQSGEDFMDASGAGYTGSGSSNANSRTESSGVWQMSLANPALPQQCGLDIAVVSDLSTSMSGTPLTTLKSAANGLVQALAGTPSKVSLYTFGTTAPAPNSSGSNNATLLGKSALDADYVSTLTGKINGYTVGGSSYTNWDAGLLQVGAGGHQLVIVITDGNPTTFRNGASTSTTTAFIELEHGILSANTVKQAGARIVAVGVGGASIFQQGQNLRALSGSVAGSDYFVSGWSELASTLSTIARGTCEGSVTVVKRVVPWNGSTGDGVPSAGWDFTAATSAAGVTIDDATQTTPANGAVNFKLAGIPQNGSAALTVTEDQQAGYGIVQVGGRNAVCQTSGGAPVPVTDAGDGFTIAVGKLDVVTCTIYNRAPRPAGQVVVNKEWVVDGGAPTSVFPAGFAASATVGGQGVAWGAATSVPAGTVEVDESGVEVPDGYCEVTAQRVTAVNGSAITPVSVAGGASYTATVAAGATTTVTLTNTVECVGILHLTKVVESGDASPAAWTLHAEPEDGTPVAGASGVFGEVTPGVTYELRESGGPAGYEQLSVGCSTDPDGPFTPMTSVTVTAQTTMHCRFVNAEIAPELRLVKRVAGADVAPGNWTLTASDDDGAVLSGDGVVDYAEVESGVPYDLAEEAVDGFDDSEFSASDWTCTVTAGPGAGAVTTGDSVELASGQRVECVVVNTVRDVVPQFTKTAGAATADPTDGTWDISYTLTATNPSSVLPLVYDLVDTPDLPAGVTPVAATVTRGATEVLAVPAWGGGALAIEDDATLAAGAAPAVYTVTLTVAIPASVPADALACGAEDEGFANSATLTPATGSPITDTACVSVELPAVSHDKVVTSATQDPATGHWTVVYDVTVTATGTGVARYDLADALAFGDGIAVVSSAATGPSGAIPGWTGSAPATVLAADATIAGGTTHIYTVTVVAHVAEGVAGTGDADCRVGQGEDGTGLLNRASLTAGGGTTVETACAEPVVPALEKSFVSATPNPDASWTVTFAVRVDNPSDVVDTAYSLGDVPGFASGIQITGTDVTLDGSPLAWDGTAPLATGRVLPAGESDEYVLVFTVTVDPGMPASARDCDAAGASHGFFNAATLTSGDDTRTDDDCGPVTESVLPLVTKTVDDGFPRQLADGDWEIRYTVTVSTPAGGALAARYDLDDALAFGDGVTVVSAAAAGPSGAIDGWTGVAPDVELADDVLLGAGGSHVYTVTVRAELAAGVAGSEAGDCTLDEEEDGTGLLNTVRLRSGSATRDAQACATTARPTLEKDLVGAPALNADGTVEVTYTVTVGNPSDLDLVYDLDDELGFAAGVTVLDQVVAGPDGVVVDADWTGAGATARIVTAQGIAAGDEHVYTVVVTARPTLFVDEGDLACVAGTPGHGYLNGAVLTSGSEVLADDACAPISPTELPTLPFPDPELPTLASTGAVVGNAVLAALGLLMAGFAFLRAGPGRRAAHRA